MKRSFWLTTVVAAFVVAILLAGPVLAAIPPFLLPDDVLVARLNMNDNAVSLLRQIQQDVTGTRTAVPNVSAEQINPLIERLREQGVKQIWVTMTVRQLTHGQPTLIVPVEDPSQANAISNRLDRLKMGRSIQLKRRDQQAVVVGSAQKTAAIEHAGGVWDRSGELESAFESLEGPAPIQVVLLPDQVLRVVRELRPEVPQEFEVSAKQLADSLQSVGLSLSVEQQAVTAKLVIQAADEGAAKLLAEAIPNALDYWAGVLQSIGIEADLVSTATQLVPMQHNDRLVLKISDVASFLTRTGVLPMLKRQTENTVTMERMKRLALATLQFEAAYGGLPPAASYDEQGQPLLSWRVHLLPFLDQQELYQRFHLDEPWNSPHNRKLIPEMPQVYVSRQLESRSDGKTGFLAPIGPTCAFTGGPEGIRIKDVPDGTSKTILYVEATPAHAVISTRPADWKVDLSEPLEILGWPEEMGFVYSRIDSSCHRASPSMVREQMRRLLERNDRKRVDD